MSSNKTECKHHSQTLVRVTGEHTQSGLAILEWRCNDCGKLMSSIEAAQAMG